MINQFATYLMNLSYTGNASEIVAPGYSSKTLPGSIANMYGSLYPGNPSRYNTHFYTYYYLRNLEACQQDDIVYTDDSRITYDLDVDFSLFNIYSNVIEQTPSGYSLQLVGNYTPTNSVIGNTESIAITKYNSTAVTVQSVTTGDFFTSTTRQKTFTNECIFPLVQDGAVNKSIQKNIGDTGLAFSILGSMYSFNTVTSPFVFNTYAPLKFDYPSIIPNTVHNTALVAALFSTYTYLANEQTLYSHANNDVVKLSAILRAMYKRIVNL